MWSVSRFLLFYSFSLFLPFSMLPSFSLYCFCWWQQRHCISREGRKHAWLGAYTDSAVEHAEVTTGCSAWTLGRVLGVCASCWCSSLSVETHELRLCTRLGDGLLRFCSLSGQVLVHLFYLPSHQSSLCHPPRATHMPGIGTAEITPGAGFQLPGACSVHVRQQRIELCPISCKRASLSAPWVDETIRAREIAQQ